MTTLYATIDRLIGEHLNTLAAAWQLDALDRDPPLDHAPKEHGHEVPFVRLVGAAVLSLHQQHRAGCRKDDAPPEDRHDIATQPCRKHHCAMPDEEVWVVEPDEYWCRLRDAAFAYAYYGWPVLPGIRLARGRCDRWPIPHHLATPYHGPISTNDVARYWQHHPHPILLHTGLHCLDVFRLSRSLATRFLSDLTNTRNRGPIAILPNNQWLFFVTAHQPPPIGLLRRTVHYHGANNWIPAPPTSIGNTPTIWHTHPTTVGWRLFEPTAFHHCLEKILPTRHRAPATTPSATPDTEPS